MKRKIGILSLGILLLAGCGAPKLEDGKEAAVTFKDDFKISNDDLYKFIKDNYALESVITMIDTYILETEFKDYMDTAKEMAKNYVDSAKKNYESEDQFLQFVQQYYGFSTIEAFQNNIYLSYMQNHAIDEYSKILVTDEDIEKYYNEKAQGDVEISHILISPKTTSDMSSEDTEKAEQEAKDKAEELLKQINAADDKVSEFKKLAKENSDDSATKDNEGAFGKKITYGDLSSNYDELLDAAYKIKDNEVYNKVVTTELGYHIVLKTKSYEKASLEELKDEIKDILANDLRTNKADIVIEALEYYRKSYDLKITDSELNRQYENYVKRALASSQANNN